MTDQPRYHHVLLDTGPLVAILTPNDVYHQVCVETMALIDPPLLTCWPVITEAAWLIQRDLSAIAQFLLSANGRELTILEMSDDDLQDIEPIFRQYKDLRPQLADLALLHLAQREGLDTVFTLDRRDFSVFRLRGKKRLRLLPESP